MLIHEQHKMVEVIDELRSLLPDTFAAHDFTMYLARGGPQNAWLSVECEFLSRRQIHPNVQAMINEDNKVDPDLFAGDPALGFPIKDSKEARTTLQLLVIVQPKEHGFFTSLFSNNQARISPGDAAMAKKKHI
ncbi:hypothetical protein GN958_ATG06892 [Phytophthora infestans]|uniref:Uncharacterized protein n=1 Tax=Phytophthora infestans TaxID=4787 RepID=A0A8S9UY49_PHYIN|nr:hypothetical protein GN958_ATG06892 [Phytophthora infestans]KAI9984758.1 hypothetical protein PInf_006186 [Phytophthora infestans]